MDGSELKDARVGAAWTQHDAAHRFGVTQAYLSMMERGTRPVPAEFAARVMDVFEVPATAVPLGVYLRRKRGESFFKQALGALGYPGFAYLRGSTKLNPAQVLMEALDAEDLDSRVTEALPWLAVAYSKLDWNWLLMHAKVHDRQNRLAFVLTLSSEVAVGKGDARLEKSLSQHVGMLERSRLCAEDTLCKESMTQAERRWLKTHRSKKARYWNLLTDLAVEHLQYASL